VPHWLSFSCVLLLFLILIVRFWYILFLSPPPRGGTGFSNQQTECHLVGVYRVPRAGLEAWLEVHITFVSGLFVVVVASTGVLYILF